MPAMQHDPYAAGHAASKQNRRQEGEERDYRERSPAPTVALFYRSRYAQKTWREACSHASQIGNRKSRGSEKSCCRSSEVAPASRRLSCGHLAHTLVKIARITSLPSKSLFPPA